MNLVRKRRLAMIGIVLLFLALTSGLVLYALRQNISLFYTPTQVVKGEAPLHQSIRLGGMVVDGSLVREPSSLAVTFRVTDFKHELQVHYRGILPDLFREGQGVVARGILMANGSLEASEILAKHDENYMPPEVKSALSKSKEKG